MHFFLQLDSYKFNKDEWYFLLYFYSFWCYLHIAICTIRTNMINRYFGVHFIVLTPIWIVSHGWWEWAMNIWLSTYCIWWFFNLNFDGVKTSELPFVSMIILFFGIRWTSNQPLFGPSKITTFFPWWTWKTNVLFCASKNLCCDGQGLYGSVFNSPIYSFVVPHIGNKKPFVHIQFDKNLKM